MAYRQLRVSDVSGNDINDEQAVSVVVRSHPDLEDGKVFDASLEEVEGLKSVGNLVELELRLPNTSTRTVMVTKAEFDKLMPVDKLKTMPGLKGRRPGFSPVRNGGNGH